MTQTGNRTSISTSAPARAEARVRAAVFASLFVGGCVVGSFTADRWLGLIPVVLMLVGAGGLWATLRIRRRRATGGLDSEQPWPPAVPEREIAEDSLADLFPDPAAPRVLRPSGSRLASFIFLLIFCGIWNGVLYFGFLRQSFGRGRGDWVNTLFLLPFVGIGVALVIAAIHQYLALHNPKMELTIKPGVPGLGETLEVSWLLTGRQGALRSLRIYLEGREEATHRQGTRTQTDCSPFLSLEVATPDPAAGLMAGQAQVTLPLDTMPSFKSTNNRIVWAIHARGDIPRRPDLKEEFVVQVRPGARTATT